MSSFLAPSRCCFVFRHKKRSEDTPMASRDFESEWKGFERSCANCKVFGWVQPDPSISPLKVCKGCRKISYCSKACQEEHWDKVHRRHCKFFSGEKGEGCTIVHNKETCRHSIAQKTAGQAVFKEKNPNYICLFDPINPKAESLQELQMKYPLPLRSGSQQSRDERIIDLLQRLLLKIKLTRQPAARLYPRDMDLIADELLQMKKAAIADNVIYPRTYQTPLDLAKLKGLLHRDLRSLHPNGRYQLWHSFLMLFDMLYCVRTVELDGMIKKPDKSLPKEQRGISRMVREGSYLKVTDQILEVLEEKLVSQEDLAAIVCNGDVERVCSGCSKDISIKLVLTWGDQRIAGTPAVLFQLGQANLFSCGAKGCEDLMKVGPEMNSWLMAVLATVTELGETRCDNCYLLSPIKDVHRFRL